MKMINIDEATSDQLNWLVAQKERIHVVLYGTRLRFPPSQFSEEELYDPCSNPDQSWHIIEREEISTIRCSSGSRGKWAAEKGQQSPTGSTEHQQHDEMFQFTTDDLSYGPTSLVAAMRCHVKPTWPERQNPYFEVPDELIIEAKYQA